MVTVAILAIFGTSFLVGLTGALMPGPLTTLTAREALRQGAWAGPVAALGHGAIELATVVALSLGLSRLLDEEGPATAAIALAGGLVLVWLGYGTVRAAPQQTLTLRPRGSDVSGIAHSESGVLSLPRPALAPLLPLAASAMLVSIANPYWVIWWASIGTAYVSESLDYGAAGIVSFYSGHVLADLLWLSVIAFALAGGRRLMSTSVYRGILTACGLFLVALGGYFIVSGILFLVG